MKKRMTVFLLAGVIGTGLFAGGCGASSGNKSMEMSESTASSYDYSAGAVEDMADEKAETQEALVLEENDTAMAEAGMGEKRIYTYHYSVETKAFDDFIEAVTEKVSQLGGYVESSEMNGSAADHVNRDASMTLRIPADKMDELLSMVQEASNVVYHSASSENVTLNYVDMQSHIQALRTEQKTLLRLIEQADKVEDVIALQSQLTQVRYEIESYESQLRTMDNLIDYSTMHLNITEVDRTTTVVNAKASFGDEVKKQFSDNLYAVGQWIRSLVIWLIGSLPVLLPAAAFAAALAVLIRKLLKRRKEKLALREPYPSGRYQRIYQKKEEKQPDTDTGRENQGSAPEGQEK